MAAHGGLITEADLKKYTVHERKPLTGTYHGYKIVTAPPPSSGGVGILQMLGVLDGTGYEKGGAGSACTIHYMTEAMRRYFADRIEHLGDPDFVKVPLSSAARSEVHRQAARIDRSRTRHAQQPRSRPAVFDGHESVETTHFYGRRRAKATSSP